ncbi:MAG TPA: hypothetical protein VFL79_13850, partial [Terriglobia bacterium]|nr:hypothetical protein [Terriglobia bacterium]
MRPTGNTSFKKNLSLRERRHYKARVRASRDAEGRVKLSSPLASPLSQCPTTTTTGPWQCPVYNALGQRVEDDQSDGQGRPMQLYYPRDIFGDRTGIWDDHSIANWVGWDIYWS